jgi:CheY-like chemotaxis protein
VKFTPEGGQVVIRVSKPDSHVTVSVSDTGVGLEPAFLPFVFDRFRQADQTSTRTQGGLGLGLAIVKHLVELHGGRISAQSDGIGQGSTFTLRLPVPALLDVAAAPTARAADVQVDLQRRSVLLVDDDPFTRELLTQLFEDYGAIVRVAASAAEAMAALEEGVADVLIADIGMPEEDGLTLMRRLRALPEPAGAMPTLALSAYSRLEDREAALRAGFNDFLGKPASSSEVLRAVDRLLAGQPSPTPGSR